MYILVYHTYVFNEIEFGSHAIKASYNTIIINRAGAKRKMFINKEACNRNRTRLCRLSRHGVQQHQRPCTNVYPML
jgi:hypothetical protein